LTFNSIAYGSDQFVSVKKVGTGGSFETMTAPGGTVTQYATGVDVTAVVNGALATGKGLHISLNGPSLSIEAMLTTALATSTSNTTFTLTGGGVHFQLGPNVTSTQQVGYGIQSVAASRLGGTTIDGIVYYLDSLRSGQENAITAGKAQSAQRILESAITDVSVIRGRLGAFERNTVQTNLRSLQIGLENIKASESLIRDTDFARETAELTRAQILTQAGTAVLATANLTAQNVLQLLG
jgi:flagellin